MKNTEPKTPNVALIGTGYWGRNIFRNLHELGVLRTVCDSDPEVIGEYRQRHPELNYTTEVDDVLVDDGVTAVAIATPAATHSLIVERAIRAGKDVFVEKPLALTSAEGRDLVALAERRDRLLMVGHILQYHPAILELRRLIAKGELGRVQYVYSNRLNIGKLRTEENILWSFAPHDISVILMLLGEEPVQVSARGGAFVSEGVYDTTLTTLEFGGGVKGHVFVSWLHPFKEQKLVVVGSRAMVVFDDLAEEKLLLYSHAIEWREGRYPVARKADATVVSVPALEPLREELSHFVECCRTREKPRTDGREGLRVLRVLERAEVAIAGRAGDPPKEGVRAKEEGSAVVHPSAIVDGGATIGAGTRVWHFSHVLRGSDIGRDCVLGQNVMVGPDVTVGDGCKIQNNVSIYKGVTLEDGVFCGPSCVFTNVYTPRAQVERKDEFLETRVGQGATIGANATVVCGVTIGRYAMIGAGAVVKSDVVDHAIVVGVPSKRIGWACVCGERLPSNSEGPDCVRCGRSYSLRDGRLTLEAAGNTG